MRLISAYVSAFGKIEDTQFDFNEGLNTIFHKNGWGKSTLSAFIKAMLYGMDSKRTTKTLPERKKYMPWGGSICGGSLTFEYDGKVYRVERQIRDSASGDTFKLIDVATGLESNDFTENLGEELFNVDRDSFAKSVFVAQSSIETEMTGSINAKMGDVASAKDDIDNFDIAKKAIEDKKKELTAGGKNPGKITVLDAKLKECNEEIEKKPALYEGLDKQHQMLRQKESEKLFIEAENAKLDENIAKLGESAREKGEYSAKVELLKTRQSELDELDIFFAAGVPDEEELSKYTDEERTLEHLSKDVDRLREELPSDDEIRLWDKVFAEGIPESFDIEKWQADAKTLQELRVKGLNTGLTDERLETLEQLRAIFGDSTPSSEDIDMVEEQHQEVIELNARMTLLEDNMESTIQKLDAINRASSSRSISGVSLLMLLVGGISLVASVVLTLYRPLTIYIAIGVVGLLVLIFGFVMIASRSAARKREKNILSAQLEDIHDSIEANKLRIDELNEQQREFLGRYGWVNDRVSSNDIADLRAKRDSYISLLEEEKSRIKLSTAAGDEISEHTISLYTSLEPYALGYGIDLYSEYSEMNLIDRLKSDIDSYQKYRANRQTLDESALRQQEINKDIEAFIRRFPEISEEGYAAKLKYIGDQVSRYNRLSEEVSPLVLEVKGLEDRIRLSDSSASEGGIEELQLKRSENDSRISELDRGISQDNATISDYNEQLQSVYDAESTKERLLSEREELQDRLDLLVATLSYLEEAKNSFLAKYMKPLNDRLQYYLGLIDEDYSNNRLEYGIDLTIDLGVNVIYRGATHSKSHLSKGYEDMINLCARFALIDMLYDSSNPIVVLDDPFTNLDEDKIKESMALLEKLAQKRQIIYFTCHSSRLPA